MSAFPWECELDIIQILPRLCSLNIHLKPLMDTCLTEGLQAGINVLSRFPHKTVDPLS